MPTLLLVAVVAASPACKLDTFTLGGGDDVADDAGLHDGSVDDGGGGSDGRRPDAMSDCIPFPEGASPQACNGIDDDCNGIIDDGYNLQIDNANCGTCGNRCSQPGANGTCTAGVCVYECRFGFVDTDGNLGNGCEYACTVTNGGVEICDLADNDCDTRFDEGLDLDSDELNCGTCGNRCLALHAEAICDMGVCTFGACEPGYANNIPEIIGCEYQCPVAVTAEVCNGIDDDCDYGSPGGGIDELPIEGLGGDCTDPGFEEVGDTGICEFGTLECRFGQEVCLGYVRPRIDGPANPASCNDLDDDCDGSIDEGFDKQNNPAHCGSCVPCSEQITNSLVTIEGCVAGACTVQGCLPGHVDLNGDPSDGCEYACTRSGPEVCDGRDNDCDGQIDNGLTPPNICRNVGACAGTTATCQADPCTNVVGWFCAYGDDVETDSCGDLPLQEARCDGLDGDCDGRIDEGDPLVAGGTRPATACNNDDVQDGVCVRTGAYACVAADPLAPAVCVLTSPVVLPSAEICDGKDNDCDGTVDEGAPDEMVPVVDGATTFYVYKYEASRPDSSPTSSGSGGQRSCSKPGVLPWRNVSHVQATAACAATGKRLCTEAEWQRSCGGSSNLTFPYGNDYQPEACNGRDVDLDCVEPDSDQVAVTGRAFGCPPPATTACVSPSGAIDMSGNLREWTSTRVGTSAYRVRGGGYDNIEEGLACDFSFIAFEPQIAFPNLGFRCCADQPDAL